MDRKTNNFIRISFVLLFGLVGVCVAMPLFPIAFLKKLFFLELIAVLATLVISGLAYWEDVVRTSKQSTKGDDAAGTGDIGAIHLQLKQVSGIAFALMIITIGAAAWLLYESNRLSNAELSDHYVKYLLAIAGAAILFFVFDAINLAATIDEAERREIGITLFCADLPLAGGLLVTVTFALSHASTETATHIIVLTGGAALMQLVLTNIIFLSIKARVYDAFSANGQSFRAMLVEAARRFTGSLPVEVAAGRASAGQPPH